METHSDLPKTKKEQVYEVFKELIMLVETPEMRKRTINIFFSWLIVAMVYYGLSFNSKNIGGNRYVASFASGFVEVSHFFNPTMPIASPRRPAGKAIWPKLSGPRVPAKTGGADVR